MDRLRISRVHFPVTVLGPGRRIGVWVQGCTLGCQGCISRDTWDADAGTEVPISDLAEWCAQCLRDGATGLTVSGGEPFQQADGLGSLLLAIRNLCGDLEFDILAYSGYTHRLLERKFSKILGLLDAVVSEPYIPERASDRWLRGSSNQEIHALSKLGEIRFGSSSDAVEVGPAIQVAVTNDSVWYIGIPRSGDMQRLEEIARHRGVDLGGSSWVA